MAEIAAGIDNVPLDEGLGAINRSISVVVANAPGIAFSNIAHLLCEYR